MKVARKEKDIEQDILEWLNAQLGCFAFKVNTAGWYDQRLKVFRKNNSKFVIPGTPDVICCYGVWKKLSGLGMGRVPIFISFEIKSSTGKQTLLQKNFENALSEKSAGFYFVVRSIEEVNDALNIVRASVI